MTSDFDPLPMAGPAPEEEFLCVRCAKMRKTCCQISEIYTSPGDLVRISEFTGRPGDFVEMRGVINAEYAEQDDDPTWESCVFRPDGSRRILQRREDGDCTFLGERGCVLPLEIRPLICRLYPFEYNADGIASEPTTGCPVELLAPGIGLFTALDMRRSDAERWHAQLYKEIREEPHAPAAYRTNLRPAC